ncbi:MAG TPA: biotin-dependent carboxyltransferase family protein [Gemmatimonadales bacterium]|nr:biotin-dependent carboxyltransferase family protein [Gemmatimonadales bacterium]
MIEVLKAPPFATVQDHGWQTGRAMGLPPGGAMDPATLEFANRLVGNPPGLAGIEWALGPGTLRFAEGTTACVLRDAEVHVEGVRQPDGAFQVTAGATVSIAPRGRDRFLYVAVRGGIDVPVVMGSRSTYLPGGFGGHEGRRLQSGDRLPGGPEPANGAAGRAAGLRPEAGSRAPGGSGQGPLVLRVTRGPQWDRFDAAAQAALLAGEFTVSAASDRMGYRLGGPAVRPREAATLPSEAACPGAVQIPDDGGPIVLMPDGPTVGGYPKVVVVIRADLGELAQRQPGSLVRFREVSLEKARALIR